MLEKSPIKKEYLLIAATVILLLLSYRLAFIHTIDALRVHSELQYKLSRSTDLSYQPGYLERKNANIDKILSQYKADTTEFRSNIINTISSIAEKENAKLTEVPVQDISYRSDNFTVEKLGFEGDYFSLVKLAHDLEQTGNTGIVRSERWKMVTINLNSGPIRKMVLEIYIEFAQ